VSKITTTITHGITLGTSGSYASPLTITSTGAVEASSTTAIYGPSTQAWAIVNEGTILGTGTLQPHGVELLAGGRVDNTATSGLIGGYFGVEITGSPGIVTNAGTITGTGEAVGGIQLLAGGSVANTATTSLIMGGLGVDIQGGPGNVTNAGTIIGTSSGSGVAIADLVGDAGTLTNSGTIIDILGSGAYLHGGNVGNTGLIEGFGGVLIIGTTGTVSNLGTILGHYSVVITGAAGKVTNLGTIGGFDTHSYGVLLDSGGTVVDAGTISGGTAVGFGGTSANRLVLDPGYHLAGKVVGSTSAGATNTLELGSAASIGTLTGLSGKFVHFGTVTVDSGARWVLSGSNTIGAGATLSNFGTLIDAGTIRAGGRLTVHTGGSEIVLSGGAASGTVLSGGSAIVSAGGKASGTIVASGGNETVRGTASGDTVASGGHQYVSSGGVASGVTVKHGGSQTVFAGGVTRGTVLSGGVEIVHGTASAGRVNSGGAETDYGKASGGVINGGVFAVASGGTAGGTVTFVSGGTLQLDTGGSFTGAIKDFAGPSPSDRIDLRGIAFTSGTTTERFAQTTSTSGILTVTSGTHTVHLTLLGAYTTSSFKLATDTHGGTRVTDPPVAGGASRTTFADIAPAGLHAGAATPGNPAGYLPGAIATNEEPRAGYTLFATGPPAGHGADHHPLLPAPR